MKKLILPSLLVFAVIFSSAFAEALSAAQFDLEMEKLRYEPYPANPGEYFDLWIKVQNTGESAAHNATFELVTEYPFSLYPGTNAMQSYGMVGTREAGIIVLEYKVKVDEDAVAGVYELKLKAFTETTRQFGVVYPFNITVENVRTDFDVVVQEASADVVSLAIANTGKNTANSVTVKIPDQENFKTTTVSNSIVGNIAPGDYTIVSFQIQPKNQARKADLEVQIDYTDIISRRRTVIKNVSLNLESAIKSAGLSEVDELTNIAQFRTRNRSFANDIWFWISVTLLIVVAILVYRITKTKKKVR